MLSGALAAVAGGLYAVVLLVVTPETVFGMLVSAQALILALFGGVGSLWGPVIGAVVLVPLAEGLNAELGDVLPGIQGVVYGVAIIAIILLRARRASTGGCATGFAKRDAPPQRRRRRSRRPTPANVAPLPRAPAPQRRRPAGAARHRHLVRRAARARRDRPRRAARAGSTASSARTAPARRRCSTSSTAFSRPDRGTIQLRRRADHRAAPEPGVPPRHRPHLSGRARLSAHDACSKTSSSAPLSARATTRRPRSMALAALDRVGLSDRGRNASPAG